MNSKISIIIPAYNAEKQLAPCLDSLLAQTYSNKEILLVNDGSKDRTAAICDDYAAKHDCIRVLHQQNAGVSAARNAALEIATGEYIAFVDSDDTVAPDYLQALMEWRAYDFVTAGYRWQDPDLNWHDRIFSDEQVSLETLKKFPSRYMGKYYFCSPWATLTKRELIEKTHLRFDTQIHSGEDTLFLLQYLQNASNIKILPQCGYHYYFYPGSLANRRHSEYWKWKLTVETAIMEFFHPCDEQERLSLLERNFDVLRDLLRDYSGQMCQKELLQLYQHPFFKECIAHKRANGKAEAHLLLFSMEHKSYVFYTKAMKLLHICQRIKNRLKRLFHRQTGV